MKIKFTATYIATRPESSAANLVESLRVPSFVPF